MALARIGDSGIFGVLSAAWKADTRDTGGPYLLPEMSPAEKTAIFSAMLS